MVDSDREKINTAITTWSGFVYQGKVAIYHVLKLLNDSIDYSDHILRLEYFDDFEIFDGSGKVISIHQVKAWKADTYGSFEGAIQKLQNKAVPNADEVVRYFHVAKEIRGKSKNDIEAENAPVKIYMYEDDSYCPIDGYRGVDNKIEEKLQSWFVTFCPNSPAKHSEDYAKTARDFLDQIVLKQVLEIHKSIHDDEMTELDAACNKTIPFNDFLSVLNDKDLNQKMGDDYYFYMLLNDFHRYYQGYCIENDDDLSEEEKKKLSCCIKQIESLDYEKTVQLIRKIMPHKGFKFESICDYKDNSFTKDETQEAFLAILHNLKEPDFSLDAFLHWSNEKKLYTPTMINKGRSLDGKVCRNIIENACKNDLEVMYEGSNFITTDIDVESVSEKVPEVLQKVYLDGNHAKHINRWKKVSLISLNNAKEAIND